MHDRHDGALAVTDPRARRFRLCAYMSTSIVVGTLLWRAVLSVPLVAQGVDPIVALSEAVGHENQIDHPMIVQSESYLRLIEPAAGLARQPE